jgi:nitrate/nitrite-specific signal transduction histidine kinase
MKSPSDRVSNSTQSLEQSNRNPQLLPSNTQGLDLHTAYYALLSAYIRKVIKAMGISTTSQDGANTTGV